jgi:hypothetical protein
MRSILLLLLVTFILSSVLPSASLKAVPPSHAKAYGYKKKTYYYYPSHNIYYDVSAKEYIVFRSGKWMKVKALPKGIKIEPAGKVTFSYGGKNIYKYNHAHIAKYGKKTYPAKHGIHPIPKQGNPHHPSSGKPKQTPPEKPKQGK